jgi:hypothetical protein
MKTDNLKTFDAIAELQDEICDQEDIIREALIVIKKLKAKIKRKERALNNQ